MCKARRPHISPGPDSWPRTVRAGTRATTRWPSDALRRKLACLCVSVNSTGRRTWRTASRPPAADQNRATPRSAREDSDYFRTNSPPPPPEQSKTYLSCQRYADRTPRSSPRSRAPPRRATSTLREKRARAPLRPALCRKKRDGA